MSIRFAVLLTLLSSAFLAAQTPKEGTIVGEVWTKQNSPYIIVGDIFVQGLGLEIRQGVTVLYTGNFQFKVGGKLTAIGSEADSIRFVKADTISGWDGIFFDFSNTGSELAFCHIEGSLNSGLRIRNSTPIIRNCTITRNSASQGGGINFIAGSNLFLNYCTISNNSVSRGSCSGSHYSPTTFSDCLTHLVAKKAAST